jgi:ABC-type transport system involved in cytochrome bd biosynthesis fused ATPase/permease subunit
MSSIRCLATFISNLLTICIFGLGAVFIVIPSVVIKFLSIGPSNVDSHDNGDDSVQETLCKLAGGLLIVYGLSISSSRVFLMTKGNEPNISMQSNGITRVMYHQRVGDGTAQLDKVYFHNDQIILIHHCVLGLMILLMGLLDDLQRAAVFIGIGSCVVLLGCTGLMVSFYPFKKRRQQQEHESDQSVPLLSDFSHTEEAEENRQDDDDDDGERDIESFTDVNHPVNRTVSVQSEPVFHSRITGTKRLIKLAGPHTFYLYAGCIVLLIRLPFSLSIPHFVSETLGCLARNNFADAKMNIFLLFALGTVDAALDFWCVFLFGLTNLKITKGVRVDTFSSILKQEMAFFDVTKSGDLASRLNSDAGEMGYDLTWFFRFSIESIVRIVSIVSYMLWRSPRLGVCAISVVPIVAAINKRYGDWLNRNAKEVQNALAQANSVAQEAFSCIRTVIAFASEDHEYDKYRDKIDRHYELNVQQLYAQGFYYMVISTFLINTVVQGLLLYVGMILIRNGQLTAEVLLAFMLYQSKLQNEVMNLFNSYTSLIKSSGAGDKVFELLDRFVPEPGTGNFNVTTGEAEVGTQFDINLFNIEFTYPSRPNQKVLNNVSIQIHAGTTVALVGKSGCGKSTIIWAVATILRSYKGINIDKWQEFKGNKSQVASTKNWSSDSRPCPFHWQHQRQY